MTSLEAVLKLTKQTGCRTAICIILPESRDTLFHAPAFNIRASRDSVSLKKETHVTHHESLPFSLGLESFPPPPPPPPMHQLYLGASCNGDCRLLSVKVENGGRRRRWKSSLEGFKTFHSWRLICRLLLFYPPRSNPIPPPWQMNALIF